MYVGPNTTKSVFPPKKRGKKVDHCEADYGEPSPWLYFVFFIQSFYTFWSHDLCYQKCIAMEKFGCMIYFDNIYTFHVCVPDVVNKRGIHNCKYTTRIYKLSTLDLELSRGARFRGIFDYLIRRYHTFPGTSKSMKNFQKERLRRLQQFQMLAILFCETELDIKNAPVVTNIRNSGNEHQIFY